LQNSPTGTIPLPLPLGAVSVLETGPRQRRFQKGSASMASISFSASSLRGSGSDDGPCRRRMHDRLVALLPRPPERLPGWTSHLPLWLGLGVAITVTGAHWSDKLRRQAQEARRPGQYVLRQRLGAGGMGEVYLAEHRLLRRPAAIKLIRPERAGDSKNLLRF